MINISSISTLLPNSPFFFFSLSFFFSLTIIVWPGKKLSNKKKKEKQKRKLAIKLRWLWNRLTILKLKQDSTTSKRKRCLTLATFGKKSEIHQKNRTD